MCARARVCACVRVCAYLCSCLCGDGGFAVSRPARAEATRRTISAKFECNILRPISFSVLEGRRCTRRPEAAQVHPFYRAPEETFLPSYHTLGASEIAHGTISVSKNFSLFTAEQTFAIAESSDRPFTTQPRALILFLLFILLAALVRSFLKGYLITERKWGVFQLGG